MVATPAALIDLPVWDEVLRFFEIVPDADVIIAVEGPASFGGIAYSNYKLRNYFYFCNTWDLHLQMLEHNKN